MFFTSLPPLLPQQDWRRAVPQAAQHRDWRRSREAQGHHRAEDEPLLALGGAEEAQGRGTTLALQHSSAHSLQLHIPQKHTHGVGAAFPVLSSLGD